MNWGPFCGRRRQWPPEARAGMRRRQFRFWIFFVAVWLFVSLAQASVALIRWLLGPDMVGHGRFFLPIPILLIVAGCVLILVATLARTVGSPLGDVVTASERVAAGDFSVRVREYGPPWLRSVARAFNSMTTRLEAQHRQRRELMADVAHELRTPLAAMQGRLEGMIDGIYPADQPHVAQVLEDTRMLGRLVEDLRTLAHSESGTLTLQREPTDIGVLVQEVAALFRPSADAGAVRLVAHVPERLPLMDIDPVRMREVLSNLVSNALRYSPPQRTVAVVAESVAAAIVLRVTDEGPGIAAADLPHVFDRFYKGTSSNGSGLGLTIARNLVAAHGGTLTAQNRESGGTELVVTLPVSG
jgi:signal transduction histidine kinase